MFFEAEFWVAVSFFIFMGIAWKMGVFTTVANGLDKRGDRIRAELEDARVLREEAQRVLADYQRRRKEAEAEADEIIRAARVEAERLAQDAQAKLADFVARRTKMAEQKIARRKSRPPPRFAPRPPMPPSAPPSRSCASRFRPAPATGWSSRALAKCGES